MWCIGEMELPYVRRDTEHEQQGKRPVSATGADSQRDRLTEPEHSFGRENGIYGKNRRKWLAS